MGMTMTVKDYYQLNRRNFMLKLFVSYGKQPLTLTDSNDGNHSAIHHLLLSVNPAFKQIASAFDKEHEKERGPPNQPKPATQVLMHPYNPRDETEEKGTAEIIVDQLIRFGFLEWEGDQLKQGSRSLKVGDVEGRSFFLYVDMLTQKHGSRIIHVLHTKLGNSKYADDAAVIIAALEHVVILSGDLHYEMHYGHALFRLAYGGFLQVRHDTDTRNCVVFFCFQ